MLQGKLLAVDRLFKWGLTMNVKCILDQQTNEPKTISSRNDLFLESSCYESSMVTQGGTILLATTQKGDRNLLIFLNRF